MTIRWGILGAANFALKQMAPAIHAARGAELAGLATSSADKAAPFQEFAPRLRVFDSYDALLSDPDIDAVYVPLPNHLHVEWTKAALKAGKHVLTEKPIAMQASEINDLIALRDQTGLLATEAYMIVHHPQWHHAKALLQNGAIGELRHVNGTFCYNNASDLQNVRNRPETGGGGIPDIGVYTYGATRWLTGEEPTDITHADVDFENGVDVLARVSARFPSFTAHWINSMRMHPCQEMTFVGTEGLIKLTAPFNPGTYAQAEVELHTSNHVSVERFPSVNHYVLQVEAFGAHIRGGSSFPWTLEDARGTQTVIDRVFAKASEAG